jgi:hypothetical protein
MGHRGFEIQVMKTQNGGSNLSIELSASPGHRVEPKYNLAERGDSNPA